MSTGQDSNLHPSQSGYLPLCSIRGYNIYLCGFTIYHISNGNNIHQVPPSTLQTYGITPAMVLVNLIMVSVKIAGHTNTHSPSIDGKFIEQSGRCWQ